MIFAFYDSFPNILPYRLENQLCLLQEERRIKQYDLYFYDKCQQVSERLENFL